MSIEATRPEAVARAYAIVPAFGKVGLLAATMLFPLFANSEAQAACTALDANNQSVPINALTTNSIATCSGATTGVTLADAPGATGVTANFQAGSSLTGSFISFDGAGNQITLVNASLNNVAFSAFGDGSLIYFTNANATNANLSVDGAGSNILLAQGVISTPQIFLFGEGNRFETSAGTTISAVGSATGNGLIAGGLGSNTYALSGVFTARSDGLLITDTGGDDTYYINDGVTFSAAGGAQARIVDSDGTDSMFISGTHNLFFGASGIENLTYIGSNTDSITFNGNADFQSLTVNIGSIGQIDIGSLMAANGTINVGANSAIRYGANGFSPAFSQSLSGAGQFEIDGGSLFVTGDNSAFSGTLRLSSGATYFGTNQNAAGAANISLNSTLLLGAVDLANQISGGGTVIMQGTGGPSSQSSLSGINSFTGGVQVGGAANTLLLRNASAAGTGDVTLSGDGKLALDFGTAGGDFTNLITGNGSLRKTGTGTLTVSNIANDYDSGTVIEGGILRITDFNALGTGAIVANAGGALMYDYSGSSSQVFTTPLMTGDGQFIKNGAGTIVISNTNTWTGGTQILEGRVGLNNGQGLGTGAIDVAQGAILGIGGVTLANNVTGAGQIIKTANNTAVLTGVNTLTGGIVIEGGAIEVASGASLGVGEVNVTAAGTLLVSNSADTSIDALLRGTGAIVKAGAGRAQLTGANQTFGAISIQSGTLAVNGTGNLGGASVQIAAGASLEVGSGNVSTDLNNDVSGDGRLVKTGVHRITINGVKTHTGGTDIQGGSLRVTDVAQLGTGAITVASGAALDINVATTGSFSQAISGAGQLRKSGAGDLTVLSNGLTGGLDITQGRVIVSNPNATGGAVTTATGAAIVFDMAAGPNVLSTTPISGDGQLIKQGAGALIIGNTNTYTGGTLINQGRVGLNVGDGLGTGTVTLAAGGELGIGGVSVANVITGAGKIVKTANNSATLSGVNTHTGGIDILQGTLTVASPTSLGAGAIAMSAGTQLIANTSAQINAALSNTLTGAGGLTKDGAGTIVVTGANTYSGATTINAGRLTLNTGNGAGTGAIAIASGASLGLGDVTLANNISGAGSIVKLSSGSTTLSGANTHTGGTLVSSGTLNTGATSLGSGSVQISSGATLAFTNAGNSVFANALSGAGTFRLLGADRLTLSSNFSLGGVQIDAARLRLNAVGQGNFTVGANGALDGIGRIVGALSNNGLVAPGNSIGTLTVQGNYTHAANAILEIEFDANGGIDLLDVTGTATINGGTLRFVSLGGAEGSGGTFLQAAGGVTGTFASIETVGAVLPLSVIYQNNSAIMAPSILTARPSTFNAQFLAAGDSAFAFVNSAAGAAHAAVTSGAQAWAEAFGSSGSRDAAGASLGYGHDSTGLAGGYTFALSPNAALGVSVGLTSSDISLDSDGGNGEQDGVLGAVYGRFETESVNLIAGVIGGSVDQTATRNVRFNGFAASVTGETQSAVWGAFAGAQAPIGAIGDWALQASGRVAFLTQSQDAYTESGTSPLRLRIGEVSADMVEGQAGLSVARSFGQREGSSVRFGAGARYQDAEGADVAVTFAGSNAGVTLATNARDTMLGYVEGELGWSLTDSVSLRAGYNGQFGEGERHEARVRVSYSF